MPVTTDATSPTDTAVRAGAVDADTHFWHPLERWRPFIDPAHEAAVVAFEQASNPIGQGKVDPAVEAKIRVSQANPASDDPVERLRWMDGESIYANVIYP